ncbi:MAG: hypothetical protein QHH02_09235, partial [Syntrophomonadaceae bacterium]|nr:hypothetical protein [Syntrophomonadaceae bacterium]
MHVEDVLVYSERPSPCPTAATVARWPELLADKLRQRGITSGRVAVEPRVKRVFEAISRIESDHLDIHQGLLRR